MATYRLYFIDKADHFQAAQPFDAPNDTEAVQIAELTHDACSDVAPHFELWRGAKPIASSHGRRAAPDVTTVTLRHQEQVLELEDIVQRSYRCLARSQRLIERTAILRRRIEDHSSEQSLMWETG